jgi:plasmid stabilization system protein ParE
MKSGYKVVWTDNALDELRQTVSYLDQNFSEREVRKLAKRIESTLSLITTQPAMFPESHSRKGVRRATILRFNSLYYRVKRRQIEILSFFSNRQDPNKLKF